MRPITNKDSAKLYEALGISSKRADELMKAIHMAIVPLSPVTESIKEVAKKCKTLEELAFAVFVIGTVYERNVTKGGEQDEIKN